jgi:hypothetical protein
MLNTLTSAFAGAAVVDVVVAVADVALAELLDELESELLSELSDWNATSRKTTPRNNSTMTMARRGSPEDSR